MNPIHLSYSTINMLINYSHCWINKQSGIKAEETRYMTEGKDGHRIIQRHIGNIEEYPALAFVTDRYEVVEKRDFDPACKFSLEIDGYEVIGFYDARTPGVRWAEIKLSSTPWTIAKFQQSNQRKLYALADPEAKLSTLITAPRLPEEWNKRTFKLYDVPCTEKDRADALAFVREGIKVFEDGDFSRGLNENGVCVDRWCPWGKNCRFKI